MQNVLTPALPRAASAGCWVTDLPGAPQGFSVQLHVLAPGHTGRWPAADAGALWVLTDGLGKAVFDGAAQRIAAPCVLRQLAGTALRVTNQGSTPMRVMRWAPVQHDAPVAETLLKPQPTRTP